MGTLNNTKRDETNDCLRYKPTDGEEYHNI